MIKICGAIVWQQRTQNDGDICDRRYNPTGAPVEATPQILENPLGNPQRPMVATNALADLAIITEDASPFLWVARANCPGASTITR